MRLERAMADLAPDSMVAPAAAQAESARTLAYRTYASVASIPRSAWERMLPGEPESWDFYTAVEEVPPPGFQLGAIAALDGERVVAAAPLFRVAYRIDTPLQGRLRDITTGCTPAAPRLMSFPVIGIGSPMSDNCALGFAPELSEPACAEVFEGLLGHLAGEARAHRSALVAVKSLDRSAEVLQGALDRQGYNRATSVPLAMLDLPYRSLDHYLELAARKDRLLLPPQAAQRGQGADRVPQLDCRPGSAARRALREHAQAEQGRLRGLREARPRLFQQGRARHGRQGAADAVLARRGALSFQLFLVGRDRVLAKQIGMKYPQARELNLYFVNWLKLIEFAIEHRIPSVEMGATTYATKLLFGGYLERRWLHFRFRGALANAALSPVAPLFDFERNDPELQKLPEAAKTSMGPRISRLAQRRGRGAS